MIAEMLLVLLLLALIIAFPIYVFISIRGLSRGLSQLRDEMARLQRRLEEGAREIERFPAPKPPITPVVEKAELPPITEVIPASPAELPPVEEIEQLAPPAPPTPPAPLGPAIEWESLLGANWLSKLGVVALAIAAAFFLKYAFESGWIDETARVMIGLIAAGLLLGLGQYLLGRARYRTYAQVLMSGGVVILFLSIYAAYNFYHFLGFTEAFAAMALAAIAASALATVNNTEAVAILCLLGAFFTPVLIHGEGVAPGDLSRLYLYLTALNIWTLLLIKGRPWYSLIVLSFAATWIIFFGSQPGRKLDFALFEIFAALFLLFACYGGVATVTREKEPSPNLTWIALAVILVGCLAFAIVSVMILADSYLLGLPSLVMAGAFLALVLMGLSFALPTLPLCDLAIRELLVFLSGAALGFLVLLAVFMAPSLERTEAIPAFVFVVVLYLVFMLTARLLQRREPDRAATVTLVIINAATLAIASLHVLAQVRLWSINAAIVWLPLAGGLTSLFTYLAPSRLETRQEFRKAILLVAQALPLLALIAAIGHGQEWKVGRGLAVWWIEFLLLSALWLWRRRQVTPAGLRADLLAAFTNATAFFGLMAVTARLTTYQGLVILCGCALAMAVYHVLVGAFVLGRPREDLLHRITYLGLALTFVTVAIPLQLKASYLTVAWAAESAALIWSGVAARERRMRVYGLALLLIAALKAVFLDLSPLDRPEIFWQNLRMLSGLAIVAASAFSACFLMRAKEHLSREETKVVAWLVGIANLYALIFLSVGIWQHLEAALPVAGRENAQQLTLSVFWCVYSLAGVSVGFWRKVRAARLFALGLLFISIIKVFTYDLRYLEQPYRIISFFGLGLILLVVSLLYTRFEERLK